MKSATKVLRFVADTVGILGPPLLSFLVKIAFLFLLLRGFWSLFLWVLNLFSSSVMLGIFLIGVFIVVFVGVYSASILLTFASYSDIFWTFSVISFRKAVSFFRRGLLSSFTSIAFLFLLSKGFWSLFVWLINLFSSSGILGKFLIGIFMVVLAVICIVSLLYICWGISYPFSNIHFDVVKEFGTRFDGTIIQNKPFTDDDGKYWNGKYSFVDHIGDTYICPYSVRFDFSDEWYPSEEQIRDIEETYGLGAPVKVVYIEKAPDKKILFLDGSGDWIKSCTKL